jgi:hypothetical protein
MQEMAIQKLNFLFVFFSGNTALTNGFDIAMQFNWNSYLSSSNFLYCRSTNTATKRVYNVSNGGNQDGWFPNHFSSYSVDSSNGKDHGGCGSGGISGRNCLSLYQAISNANLPSTTPQSIQIVEGISVGTETKSITGIKKHSIKITVKSSSSTLFSISSGSFTFFFFCY